ncbi:MAG: ketoacyl-ACP synthase III [Verrucomicrobiae bacterium]|nr:ketoacyl-ACP synthase III [Verrucomicrobiae bacterium]
MNASRPPPPDRASPRCQVAGTGAWLPERILTNADLEKLVETSDEWIVSRTGIRERRIADEGVHTSTMGAKAATRALERAGIPAREVDAILCATITPDMPFPCTACLIQREIGADRAFCFDLEAACTGFIYGLEIGRRLIESNAYKTILVVASEKLSSVTDWKDRNTCVLFGDGAGAVVVGPTTEEEAAAGRGILSTHLFTDGSLANALLIPGGGSKEPFSADVLEKRRHLVHMTGQDVFKAAVRYLAASARAALDANHVTPAELDWVVAHQANMRILQALSQRVEIPMERFVVNIHKYGNTSSASIPIVLDEALGEGKIKPGQTVLMCALGAGISWGSALIRW